MGKRGKPKRIIRCGKPKACPECGQKQLLEVIYGMPSGEVVDNIAEYDIRGCCMGPFRKVKIKDKSGNVYICQVPKKITAQINELWTYLCLCMGDVAAVNNIINF